MGRNREMSVGDVEGCSWGGGGERVGGWVGRNQGSMVDRGWLVYY